MRYIKLVVGLVILISSLSAGPRYCYESKKLQVILRYEGVGKTRTFETYDKWERDEPDSTLLSKRCKWFIRKGTGERLNAIELFREVGYEKQAESIEELKEQTVKKELTRMIAGIPLGIGMIAGGLYAYRASAEKDNLLPYEAGTGIAISITGLGVLVGSVASYISTVSTIDEKHFISQVQAVDLVDRHNHAVLRECNAKEQNKNQ